MVRVSGQNLLLDVRKLGEALGQNGSGPFGIEVPPGEVWEVTVVQVSLTTSAAPANRRIGLFLIQCNISIFENYQSATVPASSSKLVFFTESPQIAEVNNVANGGIGYLNYMPKTLLKSIPDTSNGVDVYIVNGQTTDLSDIYVLGRKLI